MKRCDICDSTEQSDTVKDLGIYYPIAYWLPLPTGHRCNRCQDSIDSALYELNLDSEEGVL